MVAVYVSLVDVVIFQRCLLSARLEASRSELTSLPGVFVISPVKSPLSACPYNTSFSFSRELGKITKPLLSSGGLRPGEAERASSLRKSFYTH